PIARPLIITSHLAQKVCESTSRSAAQRLNTPDRWKPVLTQPIIIFLGYLFGALFVSPESYVGLVCFYICCVSRVEGSENAWARRVCDSLRSPFVNVIGFALSGSRLPISAAHRAVGAEIELLRVLCRSCVFRSVIAKAHS